MANRTRSAGGWGPAAARFRLAAAAVLAAAILAAALLALDARHPPDLRRLHDLSTLVEDREGAILRVFANSEGLWRLRTTAEEVPAFYLDALKAFEDRRFDRHFGVDPLAVLRAAVQNLAGGRVVSGASTLTMQVARLLEPRPRTWRAKLIEAARAVQLEWRFSKREILDIYLTLAPFGGPVEGVRAAALILFGKEPASLTPGEAALLVALPQAPSRLRPDRWPERARAARDKVLDRAAILGPERAAEARAEPAPAARRSLPLRAAQFAASLRAVDPAAPVLRSTLNARLQDAVEALLRREAAMLDPHASAALLVVDNATGDIIAAAGGIDPFDRARAGFLDLTAAPRSPGSILKPFVYGLAFDERIVHPETLVADVPTRFGDYMPDNFDRQFRGDLTVREALQLSLNIPAVAVLSEVGPLRFARRLDQAGARLRFPHDLGSPSLPVVLGGVAVSLREVTGLFAALARGGMAMPLRTRPDEPASEGFRLLSEQAAAQVTGILLDTPPPPGLPLMAGRRAIAHKTGTSYGFRDAWAAGYTAAHTVGVWVGRPDGTPSPGHYGRNTAAPLLFRIFDLLPDTGAPATVAHSAAPPPALRRFSVGDALRRPQVAAEPDRLQILFPPNGAVVELLDGEAAAVPLKAAGGLRPLRWLIDGRPVESMPHRRDALWPAEGKGYFRATVIDARGVGASSEFRVR